MKRLSVVSIALIVVLLGCLAVYRYVYLPSNSCVQVLVSATHRITGKEGVFGNPCSVPFWYKDVRDYNPGQTSGIEERVYTVKEVLNIFSRTPNIFENQEISIEAIHADSTDGIGCNDYMILMDKEDADRKQQLMDFLTKAEMDKEESERITKELQSLPRIKTGETLKGIPGLFPTRGGIYRGHFYDEELSNKCPDGEARFVIERKVKELAQ